MGSVNDLIAGKHTRDRRAWLQRQHVVQCGCQTIWRTGCQLGLAIPAKRAGRVGREIRTKCPPTLLLPSSYPLFSVFVHCSRPPTHTPTPPPPPPPLPPPCLPGYLVAQDFARGKSITKSCRLCSPVNRLAARGSSDSSLVWKLGSLPTRF